jgi:3-methyladenine DNA glycosylase Tag
LIAMQDAIHIPPDWEGCKALVLAQAEIISRQKDLLAEQSIQNAAKIEALETEMEKLRKLLSHFVNGHRSEKRVISGPNQSWLPFENSEEFQAARAEAEAQAEILVDAYKRQRQTPKKRG